MANGQMTRAVLEEHYYKAVLDNITRRALIEDHHALDNHYYKSGTRQHH
jgi:hypothetical protein